MIDRNNLMRSIFCCQDMREEQGTRSPDIIYFYEDMGANVHTQPTVLITSTSQKDVIVTTAKSYTHQNITMLNKDTVTDRIETQSEIP